jgi:hypothetical protein
MAESVFHKIQYLICEKCLKSSAKACLQDQFRQTWHANIDTGSKTLNYRFFRNEIEFENYFNILDDRDIYTICRFRLLPPDQHGEMEVGFCEIKIYV